MELLYINTYKRHEIGSVGPCRVRAATAVPMCGSWEYGLDSLQGTYCT